MGLVYFKDNFLDKSFIDYINNDEQAFQEVQAGDKMFWVKIPTDEFNELVCSKIQEIEGNEIELVFSFFREAKENQDNDWRIHNDSIINGQQPDRAAVLYISEDNFNGINGTAFWEHKELGDRFYSSSNEEFNKILLEDSNNLSLWNLKSIIGHKQNRLLSYPCNYFHSKYPNEFVESRKVFVIFYKVKK